MSSIWIETEGNWRLLAPVGYPDEATLSGNTLLARAIVCISELFRIDVSR